MIGTWCRRRVWCRCCGWVRRRGLYQDWSGWVWASPGAPVKAAAVIGGMHAGADSIDDLDVLRPVVGESESEVPQVKVPAKRGSCPTRVTATRAFLREARLPLRGQISGVSSESCQDSDMRVHYMPKAGTWGHNGHVDTN